MPAIYISYFAVFVSALVVFIFGATRSNVFWKALIVIATGTAGLMIGGHAVVDEVLVSSLVIGVLYFVTLNKIRLKKVIKSKTESWHALFFFCYTGYMIFEAFRSLLTVGDLTAYRWIFYYLLVAIISLLASTTVFSIPDRNQICRLITISALVYFVSYLAHGYLSEILRNISRWDLQGVEWSGSAYAVFPLIIAIPAAIGLIINGPARRKILGFLLIIVAILVANYYDSRTAWIILLTFFLIALVFLKGKKIIIIALSVFIIFLAINGHLETYADSFYRWYGKAFSLFSGSVKDSDADRYLHFRIAFLAVKKSPTDFLFGYGLNVHKSVIGYYYQELARSYSLNIAPKGPTAITRTTGLTAILVDSGFIGLFLLAINFIFTAVTIIRMKGTGKILALTSLIFLALWLPVSNILDIVLLYLMIMPFGLLEKMAKENSLDIPNQKLPSPSIEST